MKVPFGYSVPHLEERIVRALLALWMLIPLFVMGCPGNNGDDDDDDDSLAAGEGYDVGDTLPNCDLTNQDGGTAVVHDAVGSRVLLVISAGWCEPCGLSADHALALYDELNEDFDFVLYETLIQDEWQGNDVSADQLATWQEVHELGSLDVWTDGTADCLDPFGISGELPVFVIADESLVIREIIEEGYNSSVEQQVEDAIRGL